MRYGCIYFKANTESELRQEQHTYELRRLKSENKIKTEAINSLRAELEEKQQEADSEHARLQQQLAQQKSEIGRIKLVCQY